MGQAPRTLLHLLSSNDTQATIESTGNASVLSFRKNGTDQWYILQERDTPAYGMSSNDLGFIATSHPTQPALMIQRSTQYVGIGTIPSYPLDVNGEINCTSLIASNNVGIGTTAPGLKEHIIGALGFPATTGSTQTGVLRLQGYGSNGVLDFSVNAGSGASLQATNQADLTQTYVLALNPNGGNVGIGTTAPGLKEHIIGGRGFPATTGSTQTGVLRLQGYGSNGVLDFSVNGGSGASLQVTNQTDLTQTYVLALNPNGGNVGIGTTSPGYPLDVRGYINASNGGGTANVYMGVSGEGAIIYENNAGGISINSADGAVSLNSDTGASLTVDSAGTSNVTIGTYITFSGNAGFGGTFTPSFPIDCGGIINTKSLLFGNSVSTLKISNAFSQSGHGTTIDLNNSLAYLIAPSVPAQVFSFTNIPGNATAVNLYFLINT